MEFPDSILRPTVPRAAIQPASSTGSASATVLYAQSALVGAVLPVLFAIVNQRLPAPWIIPNDLIWTGKIAALLLAEIGIYGILCAKFVQPPRLKWAAYIWMLALLNLTVFPLLPDGGWWRNSRALLVPAFWSAQLNLVVLWAVFGRAPWTIRAPAAVAVLSLGLCLPLAAVPQGPRHLALIITTQTLTLLAICIRLRWLRYRLIARPSPSFVVDSSAHVAACVGPTEGGQVQFGLKDMLLWTTLTAMLLGLGRAFGFLSQRSFLTFIGSGAGALLLAAAVGVLTAFVLIATLNVVLGDGKLWPRWRFLAATMLLGVAALAALYSLEIRLVWFLGPVGPFWSLQYWDSFVFATWPLFVWANLATALFLAVLLFPRALGYRLCREPKPDN